MYLLDMCTATAGYCLMAVAAVLLRYFLFRFCLQTTGIDLIEYAMSVQFS